jgi:hypothetical protein
MNVQPYSQLLTVLDTLEYYPLNSAIDEIVYKSVKKSLGTLGESISETILNHICSLYRLSEKELLTNYDLFEKSLYSSFNEGAYIIIKRIKREILSHAVLHVPDLTADDILNQNFTVHDIIKKIHEEQICDFIRKLPADEHVIFFYKNKSFKDKILSAFFEPAINHKKALKGLISVKRNTSNNLNLDSNILFDELFFQGKKSAAVMKKLFDWAHSLKLSNNKFKKGEGEEGEDIITRIATDDDTWFFKNGLGDEIISAEKSGDKCIKEDKITCLCIYNISNMTDEQILKAIIATHGYVILDDPLGVYKARRG